jgi:hypothetical protein
LAIQRRRRRIRQLQASGLIVVAAGVVLFLTTDAHGHQGDHHHAAATTAGAATPATSKSGHGSSHSTRSSGASTVKDPLTSKAVKRWIASRQGKVTAAVEDLKTGQEWILNPSERDQTASIVKADILETLLYQAQEANTPLSDAEADTAQGMIEASDNDDASDLWSQVGGPSGISAYNAKAGLTQTTPAGGGYWGETLTSAADQIKILRQLELPHGVLNTASKKYQLGLMENIDPGENWGVTGGVPTHGVTVALKNGWVPLTSNSNWEVNSIGWIDGDHHNYLLAVLTAHDSSYQYGIDTIAPIASDVYGQLGPAAPRGTATYSQSNGEDDDDD